MKKIILLIFIGISCLSVKAQRVVIDKNNIQNVLDNHAVTYANLVAMKNQTGNTKKYNEKIATDVTQIALIRDRLYFSLQDVQSIEKYTRAFNQINKLMGDIAKYQSKMLDYASEEPLFMSVAISAETQLISQMINILSYMEMAVNGSSDNLMNVQKRLQLLNHVILELRKARGQAYTVVRKMKVAKNRGLLYALTHNGYSYHQNQEQLKNEILNNYKLNK